jgi:hypothetical protein
MAPNGPGELCVCVVLVSQAAISVQVYKKRVLLMMMMMLGWVRLQLTTDWETDTFHIDRKLQVRIVSAHPIGTATTSVYILVIRTSMWSLLLTRSQRRMGPCHRPPRHLDNTFGPCGSNASWARGHNSRQSRHRWARIGQRDSVMCRLSRPRHPFNCTVYY